MNMLGTGSQRECDAAIIISANGSAGLYGRIGTLSSAWDAGGPIDAPETLPAGAMNSTEWVNGRGHAVGRQSEIRRA